METPAYIKENEPAKENTKPVRSSDVHLALKKKKKKKKKRKKAQLYLNDTKKLINC